MARKSGGAVSHMRQVRVWSYWPGKCIVATVYVTPVGVGVCVCACVLARARARARVCVCVCVRR